MIYAWNSAECDRLGVEPSKCGEWEVWDANGMPWHNQGLLIASIECEDGIINCLKTDDDGKAVVDNGDVVIGPINVAAPIRVLRKD